jgi:hypothetical protein
MKTKRKRALKVEEKKSEMKFSPAELRRIASSPFAAAGIHVVTTSSNSSLNPNLKGFVQARLEIEAANKLKQEQQSQAGEKARGDEPKI